jgi:hypothetical protein
LEEGSQKSEAASPKPKARKHSAVLCVSSVFSVVKLTEQEAASCKPKARSPKSGEGSWELEGGEIVKPVFKNNEKRKRHKKRYVFDVSSFAWDKLLHFCKWTNSGCQLLFAPGKHLYQLY